ncbi:MAG: imelysin family protein [Leeuwenhoekiella sp.]
MKNKYWSILPLTLLMIFSCTEDEPEVDDNESNSDFDRAAILTNWADNIIIPSYGEYTLSTENLNAAAVAFSNSVTVENLESLRAAYAEAYIKWQHAAIYEIGPAETLQLRNFTNIYPINVTAVEANISGETYNLELPSTFDEQGFPVLDYLLYGAGDTAENVNDYFKDNDGAKSYLLDLTERLDQLSSGVLTSWTTGYRDDYVADSGDAVNAAFSKTVNQFINYYERHLRSGKVGIPAGALSGNPSPERVEAFYQGDFSKDLLTEAILATQNFFNGKAYQTSATGASLKSALISLERAQLATDINAQFETILNATDSLNNNFSEEVANNNTALLNLRDELQRNTILFKTDMVSALNVTISIQDNDGD